MEITSEKVFSRRYVSDHDYAKIRQLLIESYSITHKWHNWQLDRLDSWRYGRYGHQEITGQHTWEADIHLWVTETGKLVGAMLPEAPTEYFFQVHPHYRHIELDMLDWVEAHVQAKNRYDPLDIFVYEYDCERIQLLRNEGFKDCGACAVARWRSLDAPIPDISLPAGYTLRHLNSADPADQEHKAAATNAVFGTSFTAEAYSAQRFAPTYRPDLDLAIIAPDGTFAAFCTLWLDEQNQVAVYEPVGTHPQHRRLGLASAVMIEGMKRVKGLGAKKVMVSTGFGMDSNWLYEALGFLDYEVEHRWEKIFLLAQCHI